MTDREAMRLALDALDSCEFDYDWEERPYKTFDEDLVNVAVDALHQALDHVPDTMKMLEPDMGIDRGAWDDVPDATKWVDELRGGDETEQEPYCWVQSKLSQGMFYKEKPRRIHTIPLYTAPPSKPWVSLTDHEIAQLDFTFKYPQGFARAIEAALRSKNNG